MKNKKKNNTSKIMLLLSSLLMIIILIYLLLNSSLFNSSNIKIEGNNIIKTNEIIDTLDISKNKNIFKYNKKQMEKYLMDNKYIENVKIKINLPNELKIMIIEKDIGGILRYEENYCYIDYKGQLIEEIKKIEDNNKQIIIDIKYNIVRNETIEFENEKMKKTLLDILDYIKLNKLEKKIERIAIEKNDIVNLYTKDRIKIVLPNNNDIKYNIAMMGTILLDLQGENAKGGILDFTCGNNPIYKP